MDIIELETAIEIARKYIYLAPETDDIDNLTEEMSDDMRNNRYDVNKEELDWNLEKITEDQLKLIRFMVYHDYENLTKGDANRIIRILKQTDEDI